MKKLVYKFDVPNEPHVTIKIQDGAEILSFQGQRDCFRIWALVNPAAEIVERKFVLLRTGRDSLAAINGRFIGTAQIFDGRFVCHLFELL